MSIVLILSIILTVHHSSGQDRLVGSTDSTCYANNENPYLYFSSKTTYNAVYYRNNAETIPSECKPRQLWMLIRHGERYPLKRKMEAFQKLSKLRNHIVHNHEQHHRGELCDNDIQNLKDWAADNIPLKKSDNLAKQGYDNLREIGDRTWNKFNELFKSSYSESAYKVQYTNHEKTKHSAEAFTNGLFGEKIRIPEPTSDDLLTRIYPDCKVLPIPEAADVPDGGKRERSLFKDSPIVAEVTQNISKRLGFTYNLKFEDIENMYDMCRYKKSWAFEDLPPWCACFLESDLKILEYIGDLSYYYNSGHGNSANLRTGCPLVQDMVHRFRDMVNNRYNNQLNALFYFGHSTTLYNLFARLGVAKDTEHITHNNYDNMTNRKWRTSLIGPFSANFAAVLLKCNSGIKDRVVFYHNESPFRFKECHGYVCPWDTIEEMYGNITDPSTCNFNFCADQQYITQNPTTMQQTEKPQSYNEIIRRTSERSNAIVKEIPKTYETNRNKILHRTVTKIKDPQEINTSPTTKDNEFTINRVYVRNIQLDESESDTFKQKKNWTEKDINLSWLFVSFMVVVVVLVLCNHYTSKRNQSKNGYEKMFTLQMNKINKI